jgi:hypothetical protein
MELKNMDFLTWTQIGMAKVSKNGADLSKALGLHRSAGYKILSGERAILGAELPIISKLIEEPIPDSSQFTNFLRVKVGPNLCVGDWAEKSASDRRSILVPRDPEYPKKQHLAYLFKGDSMNKGAILDGDTVICIKADIKKNVVGKQVVIERKKGKLIEMSVRLAIIEDNQISLVCLSTNKSYKPLLIDQNGNSLEDGEQIKVLAFVRRVTRFVE